MRKMKSFALAGLVAGLLSISSLCFAASSVKGDKVDYDFRTGQAVAVGNVKLRNDDGTASAEEAEYNTKTGEGKLTGSVVADQKDAHVTAAEVVIKNKGKYLSAVGNAVLKKEDKTLRAAQVNYDSDAQYAETVGDWAQMTMTDGSSLDSATMNYNMKNGIAHADGNVRLISPPRKLTARADRAVYNAKAEEGTIQLIGHATATQDQDTVSGDTLTIKGAGGKIAMGEGNVKMVVIPRDTAPQQTEEVGEPVVALAGNPDVPDTIYTLYNWPGTPLHFGDADMEKELTSEKTGEAAGTETSGQTGLA